MNKNCYAQKNTFPILKLLLIAGAVFICTAGSYAQTWNLVGSRGFSAGLATGYHWLAIDGSGTPYVVYFNLINRSITLAKFNGSNWQTLDSVMTPGAVLGYTSLAIDTGGNPYIIYENYGTATVMKYNGSSLVNVGGTVIDSTVSILETNQTIAIDRSGMIYVGSTSYSCTPPYAEVYMYNGSGWVWIGNLSGAACVGGGGSSQLVSDTGGTPYVVYNDVNNGYKATVMKYNGGGFGGWVTIGSAGFSAGQALYTSIAIDNSGTSYVVYQDGANGNKATVMKYNGSSWVNVGSPGFSAGRVDYTQIAIDGSGTPYVVYQDSVNNGKATSMKYNGSSWVNVGSPGFSDSTAGNTCIAINSGGNPYVVFQDYADGGKATVMVFGTVIAPITGIDTVCVTDTTTLHDITTGGIWSSSNTSVATVGSLSGLITGIAAGTATISYSISGSSVTFPITANTCPSVVKNIIDPAHTALTIFPNPNPGIFTLNLSSPTNENAVITITDILGLIVKEFTVPTNKQTELQLNEPAGVYFITAVLGIENLTSKIVIE